MTISLHRNTLVPLLVVCLLSACTSTQENAPKEFEWIAPSGKVASERGVTLAKTACEYDANREESRTLITEAYMKHQEDAEKNETEVNALIKQAKELLREGATCMRKYGFMTREKR